MTLFGRLLPVATVRFRPKPASGQIPVNGWFMYQGRHSQLSNAEIAFRLNPTPVFRTELCIVVFHIELYRMDYPMNYPMDFLTLQVSCTYIAALKGLHCVSTSYNVLRDFD